MRRNLLVGMTLVAAILALGIVQACTSDSASSTPAAPANGAAAIAAAAPDEVPLFEVDPFWPKPLPDHGLLGATIGVAVDSRDHVYIVHRNTPDQFAARTEVGAAQNPPLSECCVPAPPVLEFDPDGNLVAGWGGPIESGEYEWPDSNHGIEVDHMDNVWIGGNGGPDSHILKFSRAGEFLMQVGRKGARMADGGRAQRNSLDPENFGRVAKVFVDPQENEVYLADGYLTAASLWSTLTRENSNVSGAPTAMNRMTVPTSGVTRPAVRRLRSSGARSTVPTCPTTDCCTYATAPRIESRCSSPMARTLAK